MGAGMGGTIGPRGKRRRKGNQWKRHLLIIRIHHSGTGVNGRALEGIGVTGKERPIRLLLGDSTG